MYFRNGVTFYLLRLMLIVCFACTLLTAFTYLAGRVLRANAPELIYINHKYDTVRGNIIYLDVEQRRSTSLGHLLVRWAWSASVSPDGSRLAVIQSIAGQLCVFEFILFRWEMCHNLNDMYPSEHIFWLPDNEQLMFGAGDTTTLYSIHFNGQSLQAQIEGLSTYDNLSLSPDGKMFAFRANDQWQSNGTFTNLDSVRNRLSELAIEYVPIPEGYYATGWSPDSQWLLLLGDFQNTNARSYYSLYIMRPDGTEMRAVFQTQNFIYAALWSPDGEWIAFTMDDGSNVDVYRVRLDGSGLERLTHHPDWDVVVAWRP